MEPFKPLASITISGHEISNNLRLAIDLQFADAIWTIVWEKTVNVVKQWHIDVQNIDNLSIQSSNLLHEIVGKAVSQLLFAIITDECDQEAAIHTQVNCTDIDFKSKIQSGIVKPLLESYMAHGTACAQSEFAVDHLQIVQPNEHFDGRAGGERSTLPNIVRFDVKLCH